MSCSPFDLNDYFLKELPDQERREVESHVRECRQCCEELERLRLTEASLFALREEEIPQRIAFVSDKVFEPTPWRRWWGAFWGSAARLAFASSAMLSVAILVFALTRGPAQRPVTTAASAAPADVQAQIQAAVDKAVHESEARQSERWEKTEKMVADLLNQQRDDNKKLALADESFNYLTHRLESNAAERYRQSSAGGPQ
jgi:anti-sigma factor RsiW